MSFNLFLSDIIFHLEFIVHAKLRVKLPVLFIFLYMYFIYIFYNFYSLVLAENVVIYFLWHSAEINSSYCTNFTMKIVHNITLCIRLIALYLEWRNYVHLYCFSKYKTEIFLLNIIIVDLSPFKKIKIREKCIRGRSLIIHIRSVMKRDEQM